jgi:hypothetical protein
MEPSNWESPYADLASADPQATAAAAATAAACRTKGLRFMGISLSS